MISTWEAAVAGEIVVLFAALAVSGAGAFEAVQITTWLALACCEVVLLLAVGALEAAWSLLAGRARLWAALQFGYGR